MICGCGAWCMGGSKKGFSVLIGVLAALAAAPSSLAAERRPATAIFQLWNDNKSQDWSAVCADVKALGFTRVLVQNVSYRDQSGTSSFVEEVRAFAKACPATEIILGLQRDERLEQETTLKDATLLNVLFADVEKDEISLVDEAQKALGKSLVGIYIPLEIANFTSSSQFAARVRTHFAKVTKAAKNIDVYVSLHFNSQTGNRNAEGKLCYFSGVTKPGDATKEFLRSILETTGIDHVLMQDGAAARCRTAKDFVAWATPYFEDVRSVSKELNMSFGVIVEAMKPANEQLLEKQLDLAHSYSADVYVFEYLTHLKDAEVRKAYSEVTARWR